MADFVFPPGGENVTVTAPNGITYVWDVDNGRWAIRSNSNKVSSIVHVSVSAPTSSTEGDLWYDISNPTDKKLYIYVSSTWEQAAPGWQEFQDAMDEVAKVYYGDNPPTDPSYELWYDTGLLELCVLHGGMWFPATAITQDIPSLQEVLENSPPVTNRDIYLTNGVDDIIDLAPTEARVVIGTVGTDVSPKFELRHKDGPDDSLALFEIDDNGKRLDIETDGKIDNIHFKFSDQDKFILNKDGDAEFTGRVVAQPGQLNNELVTYEQLQNVSGEIDEIKIQKEKGNWIVENPPVGSSTGRHVLIDDPDAGSTENNQIIIEEKGGDNGAGLVSFLLSGDETLELRNVLNALDQEYRDDPDAFKDKYSFFCPWAEGEGLAVREQPFYKIEATSLSTFLIFYNGPVTSESQKTGVGIEIFQDNTEIDLPEPGDFYMEVYREVGNFWEPTLDFEIATRLVFHKVDSDNVTHSFNELVVGDSIRVNDIETGHFLIAEVTQIWAQFGNYIRFGVKNLSHSGLAREDEKCLIEFYKFNDAQVILDDYVQKSGDTMTGGLICNSTFRANSAAIYQRARSSNPTFGLRIYSQVGDSSSATLLTHNVLDDGNSLSDNIEYRGDITTDDELVNKRYVDVNFVNKSGETEMSGPLKISGYTSDSSPTLLVYPNDSSGPNSDALKVYNKEGESQFYVTIGGDVAAGTGWSPTKDIHLATKKYCDETVGDLISDSEAAAVPGSFYEKDGNLYYKFKS